jgi:NAD(P)-dependent dehydrogenase (short-subunit alcohol dehydrogenase family)
MKRLENKVAIITGAGSGMGEATAILLGNEGASVVCMDIKNADRTASQIVKAGGNALAVAGDVSESEDWENVLNAALANFGHVDILCNIAGIAEATNVVDSSEEQFERVINVNLKGVMLGMKIIVPEFIKNGGGKIVNMASLSAHCGLMGLPNYTASKGAVLALTRQVAMDYAKNNIQVNSVSPGLIDTPMNAGSTPEMLASYKAAIPQGELGRPEDVAYAVLFLSSGEANYITGQDLLVDGGWCAH